MFRVERDGGEIWCCADQNDEDTCDPLDSFSETDPVDLREQVPFGGPGSVPTPGNLNCDPNKDKNCNVVATTGTTETITAAANR